MTSIENIGNPDIHIVAVGASAGGLEALIRFISGLDTEINCAYVIAHHSSVSHRNQIIDVLNQEAELPVRNVVTNTAPEINCIHIIPPGYHLEFIDGKFNLIDVSPQDFPKPSIDRLFHSLAHNFGERAVAVILSGTGSDGAIGLRSVKNVGGITLAQSPDTAKYIGMVRAAIDSGFVEAVLAPELMGQELRNLTTYSSGYHKPDWTDDLKQLFNLVYEKTEIDFSNYKRPTILRRLKRRMSALDCKHLKEYLNYIHHTPGELNAFVKETLIPVTEFFRDRSAFQLLARHVEELTAQKLAGDEIRVWCIGCATGEEAYSIAIVFAEEMGDKFASSCLQIFATDVDETALQKARQGFYTAAELDGVPAVIVEKYFDVAGHGFAVKKIIKEKISFARHNLIAETPLIRMDVISCRNLLIYFNEDLQKKALSIFQYALNANGLLFLGMSENIDHQTDIFAAENKRLRLYRLIKSERINHMDLPTTRVRLTHKTSTSSSSSIEQLFLTAAINHYSTASMLIDQHTNILYSHGQAGKFIQFPSGAPEMILENVIVPEFKSELITLLHRARQANAVAHGRKHHIKTDDNKIWRVSIAPIPTQSSKELFLIMFQPFAGDSMMEETRAEIDAALVDKNEIELMATKDYLQSIIDKLSASNLEMQAITEETQLVNEELKTSNEELEAVNQELQATNELLFSVNEKSLERSGNLMAINADFESVYNTLEFPVLVFDEYLNIKRANIAATKMFPSGKVDSGQHISQLPSASYFSRLEAPILAALNEKNTSGFSIQHEDSNFHINPLFDPEGMPQGIVLSILDNSDLMLMTKKQRETQDHLQSIMNNSISVISLKDIDGRYEFVNKHFVELSKLSQESILGKTDAEIFDEKLAKQLHDGDFQVIEKLESVSVVEELNFNGKLVWFSSVRFPIFDQDGKLKSICLQATDISHVKIAEEQLRLAARVFDRSGEAIMITDAQNRIATVNEEFINIFGYEFSELIGMHPTVLSSGTHDKFFYSEMWRSLLEQGWWQGEITNRKKSGELCPSWVTINVVYGLDGAIQNFVALFSDPDSIKIAQRKVEFMATHDELTHLPNRSLLLERLKSGVAHAERENKKLAVVFIDLDNFKNINDTLGHDVGDILLKQAAQRLNTCVRGSDTLARLGGDEFVALLNDIDLTLVNQIAERIVDFMAMPFHIGERDLFVSGSVGISIYPDNGVDEHALLKNADTAMYCAKELGRNQFQFFTDKMKASAMQRLKIETAIRHAMIEDYFRVVYQPQLDMQTGKIVGAEALLRWHDPILGDVEPSLFIPAMEKAGLIRQVGEMVLHKVLQQINLWRKTNLQLPNISINVSATQLRNSDFTKKLLDSLHQYQVPTELLTLELTESVLTDNFESVNEILLTIKESGIAISIDDFGTGYSSMMYLKRLPIHELKIDRSFVDGIVNDNDDLAITSAIISMAHALGLKLVAEGVESKAQAKVLRNLGCQSAQGFLFHHPLEFNEFEELLHAASNADT